MNAYIHLLLGLLIGFAISLAITVRDVRTRVNGLEGRLNLIEAVAPPERK